MRWVLAYRQVPASTHVGLLLILGLALLCFPGAEIYGVDPARQGNLLTERYLSPGSDYWFGTDKFGRDMFARVLHGGRISILLALGVVATSTILGCGYGGLAGYLGGRVDRFMMRLLDAVLAVPLIYIILAIASLTNLSILMLFVVLVLSGWMDIARIVRAEVMTLKQQDFVIAARGLGYGLFRIIRNHVLPHCLGPILVLLPLKVAEVVLLESALSFLGVGVPPPAPSWGNLINDGKGVLYTAWWVTTIPGVFLTMTVVAFNLVSQSSMRNISDRSATVDNSYSSRLIYRDGR